jgi:pyruvate kinase
VKDIKIICTVGPSSYDESIIKKMDESGVDLFRINLSHTNIDDFTSLAKNLMNWTDKPVCLDTEGAQLRTLLLCDKIIVKEHDIIEFVDGIKLESNTQIGIRGCEIEKVFKNGDLVSIDFDGAVVQIIEHQESSILGRVLHSGNIGNNKGVNVDRLLRLNSFTHKDEKAFSLCQSIGIKHLFLSFCSHESDVDDLRNKFSYDIKVISKIESKNGLINLDGICDKSDALLIDRGDLSREVPLEKIPTAQKYILQRGNTHNVPVYVATNLMENMIVNSKPTRAEVNDIQSTLNDGASGLVLAAETAIGKYPIECIRIMSRIVYETIHYKNKNQSIENLFTLPSGRIIDPHGGKLVQQFSNDQSDNPDFEIMVSEEVLTDSFQIANGTYSPLEAFMSLEQIKSVLYNNSIGDMVTWTIPIIFQVDAKMINRMPKSDYLFLKKENESQPNVILKIDKIEKLKNKKQLAQLWFGTQDEKHPGVFKFLSSGDYIISGKPYILNNFNSKGKNKYELTPSQSRFVFDHNGWHNVIGFHTRNVPHLGHEHIQKQALVNTNADAIFISPVTGVKKAGDFLADPIIKCYELLIREGVYDPYGAIIGSFNTHSRYSGPREAVFTAICRQNYGCNYFIVGRDHTGVGNYYDPDASIKLLDKLELDIKVLTFNSVGFSKGQGFVEKLAGNQEDDFEQISGSLIREKIINDDDIPDYMMRPTIVKLLQDLKKVGSNTLFH